MQMCPLTQVHKLENREVVSYYGHRSLNQVKEFVFNLSSTNVLSFR